MKVKISSVVKYVLKIPFSHITCSDVGHSKAFKISFSNTSLEDTLAIKKLRSKSTSFSVLTYYILQSTPTVYDMHCGMWDWF